MKLNETERKSMIEDFTKILQFKIITTIKNHYGSLEKFKSECNDKSNRALERFNKNFHVDSKILQSLTRDKDANRHLDEVLKNLDKTKLVYKHKCSIKYKSGKKFNKPSTFHIPFKELERLFALIDSENTPFKTDSGYYTEKQHRLIDKLIFGYHKKERKEYTKSEKFLNAVKIRTEKNRVEKIISKPDTELTDAEMNELIDGLDLPTNL